MFNKKIIRNIIQGFAAASLIILLVFCSEDKEKQVLARVGDSEINSDSFVKNLIEIREKYELPDNGQVRRSLLKKMLHDKMFVSEAERLGFNNDSTALFEKEKIQIQNTLNVFVEQNIIKNLKISDAELKKYYILSSTKIRARHLYAPTKEKADSIYNLIQQGQTFENLAKNIFKDPLLNQTGGDLGYFTYEDMDFTFSDQAFSMQVGEVSVPIKTNDGYSIIKVEDRVGSPLLTEIEFLTKKNKLYADYRSQKKKILARNFVDSLAHSLNIVFNKSALNLLFPFMKNSSIQNFNVESGMRNNFSKDYLDMELLSCENFNWTINDFFEKARFTSQTQRNWIRNKENLRDFISGVMVRQHVLKSAEKQGLVKTNLFKDKVNKNFNQFLVNRIKEQIKLEMVFLHNEMKTYYNDNIHLFKESSNVFLSEIIVNDETTAIKIVDELNAGKEFSGLARKYSVNKNTAVRGGEVGYVSIAELGPFAKMVFNLKNGEWTGPFKKGNMYFLLQKNSELEGDLVSFDKAKPTIREKLIAENFETAVKNKLKAIRQNVDVFSYPEKLKTIRYYN